jgi:ectoine hydroxylase-related dioxygenase (phytanoyl-CoA dioxygenase family)
LSNPAPVRTGLSVCATGSDLSRHGSSRGFIHVVVDPTRFQETVCRYGVVKDPETEGTSMLNAQQLERFLADGAVTVDSPLSEAEIAAAAAAIDRALPDSHFDGIGEREMRRANRDCCLDEELTAIVQHPFLEALARTALDAERVAVYAMAVAKTAPQPGSRPDSWEHVDLKYQLAELDARPRRMLCSCIVWLTDVTVERAPLMFRPGSHRLIAAYREGDPSLNDQKEASETLPRLPYAERVPLLARRGQVSVVTTAALHGPSTNLSDQDRLAMFVPFYPVGVPLSGFIRSELDRYSHYHRDLLARLRPDRRHLAVIGSAGVPVGTEVLTA